MNTANRRVAIVTGGAQGIGAGIARRLAAEGIAVAVLDRNLLAAEECVRGLVVGGATAVAVEVDVADEASVTAAVARVAQELGAPQVLVNNAGVLRDNMLFKMTAVDWDLVLGVHLRGAFLMSRAVQSHMVAEKWGRIVNLSSTSALGNRGQANYSAAKAGVQGFTKTLAWELGPFGVTVNAVAPGFIATDMTRATAERMGVTFDELQASAAAAIAVRRVGTPDDVADAVAFFVGEGAGFVSGQVLYVAGGPHG
ncbi:SDR family oxidoreductase [Cryobacterium sp. PH31-O1]|uniref:SDR family oxidoreductase n=1 Tax=Cryobacterium sp. PH31-O1 TaxID=3046306 RepID=UPI0024BBE25D|nr:SDR family oxidoreductase [Cryobacterium sp. PH31-O1]MDJ0337282.1 SDR family oxidoreductase [Cryobacterium sp. PH31-O1]